MVTSKIGTLQKENSHTTRQPMVICSPSSQCSPFFQKGRQIKRLVRLIGAAHVATHRFVSNARNGVEDRYGRVGGVSSVCWRGCGR